MRAYYFRRKDCEKTMFIGIAVVHNLKELFWTIDEHDDPYGYEFAPAVNGDSLVVRAYDVTQQSLMDAGHEEDDDAQLIPFHTLSVTSEELSKQDDRWRVEASESMTWETDLKWRTFGENFKCL